MLSVDLGGGGDDVGAAAGGAAVAAAASASSSPPPLPNRPKRPQSGQSLRPPRPRPLPSWASSGPCWSPCGNFFHLIYITNQIEGDTLALKINLQEHG